MKRAFSLIEPKVKDYLDNFGKDSLKKSILHIKEIIIRVGRRNLYREIIIYPKLVTLHPIKRIQYGNNS